MSSYLSGGEQQRIGFARLLVLQPNIVIMDKATAALDASSQDSMMELFRNELEHATLISVGHRVELEEYHERKLTLHPPSASGRPGRGRGAARRVAAPYRHAARVEMASDEDTQRGRRLSRLLRRSLRPRPSPDPSSPVSG